MSMQSIRSLGARLRTVSLGRLTWVPTLALCATVFSSPFVADEVFVMLSISHEFSSAPTRIFSTAWSSFQSGLEQGRLVSPGLHVLSNAGVGLTDVLAQALSIDLYVSNGVWRTLLFIALFASFARYVRNLYPDTASRLLVKRLSLIVGPGLFVANRPFTAGRLSIWSYILTAVLAVLLLIWLQSLFRRIAKFSSRYDLAPLNRWQRGAILAFEVLLLGCAFGTTYELTRVLSLVAVFTAVRALAIVPSGFNRVSVLSLSAFTVTTFGVGVFVQLFNSTACTSGCYQPAHVQPEKFSVDVFLSRILSVVPPFDIREGMYSSFGLSSNVAIWVLAIVCFLSVLGVWISLGDSDMRDQGGSLRLAPSVVKATLKPWAATTRRMVSLFRGGGFPAIIGLTWMGSVASGMAVSRSFTELTDPWQRLGVGNRDTLVMHLGFSVVLVSVLHLIRSLPRTSFARTVSFVLIGVLLAAAVGMSQVSNLVTTSREWTPSALGFQRLLVQLSSFSTGEEDDEFRCQLLRRKITEYPEWRGHDAYIYGGLDIRYRETFGYAFCPQEIAEFFEEYPD